MSTMFHRRLLMALLVSLAFAAFPAFTYANHSWNGYHWARTSNPFTLKLGDNVSSAWDAVSRYHVGGLEPFYRPGHVIVDGRQTNPRNCRPTSGRWRSAASTYGNNGWLGVASDLDKRQPYRARYR